MSPILIIDDDSVFRNLIADWLQQSGWRVLQAQHGQEGLELAKVHRPEIILCDLLMTPVNGFQFCSRLREIESLKHARVIVTSGRDFEVDRRSAIAAGADEYLTKPVELAELKRVLSRFAKPQAGSVTPPPLNSPSANGTGMTLRFWGVRGSIATPGPTTLLYGGNTSCIEVRAGQQILILDAGTGLRSLGRALLQEFGETALDLVLLLTHTHWDHIQGLPFFQPVYKPQNHLRVLGYEGARKGLHAVLNSQMETPFFPIGLNEIAGNISIEELSELNFQIGPVQVKVAFANHPGICVGYRLFYAGHSLAFFPDNELRHGHDVQKGTPVPSLLEYARQENSKLADFLRGTDVLIMDTQYDRDEYLRHMGWGHGCLDEVVSLSLDAGVRKLFLFHHDPEHDDEKIAQMVDEARRLVSSRGGALEVEAAREGLSVKVPATPIPAI